MFNAKEHGKLIKKERENLSLTKDELADVIGITRQTLSTWESGGGRGPTAEELVKMADVFDCEVGYLVGEFDEKTRATTDIHKYTSLTAEAIERIHTSKTTSSVLNLLFSSKDKEGRCLIDVIGEYLKFNVNQDAFISKSGDLIAHERSNLSDLEKELNPGFYLSKDAFTELYLTEIRDWLKHIRETSNTELK